jgi:hypothetical protein
MIKFRCWYKGAIRTDLFICQGNAYELINKTLSIIDSRSDIDDRNIGGFLGWDYVVKTIIDIQKRKDKIVKNGLLPNGTIYHENNPETRD